MTARVAFDRFDRQGRRLHTTSNRNTNLIVLHHDDGQYELDDDAAIGLAHDLLERCGTDCDEIIAARAALRELERQVEPGWYDPDEPSRCDEFDWRSLT